MTEIRGGVEFHSEGKLVKRVTFTMQGPDGVGLLEQEMERLQKKVEEEVGQEVSFRRVGWLKLKDWR